jgi:hypothetical protein
MIKKIPLLICFLCSTTFLSFGQTTICDTIINMSDEDALVCDFFPTTNLSTSEDYMFSSWTAGGVPYIFRALHKFNLSVIPAGSLIQSAKLYLYFNNTSSHPEGNSYYPGSPYPNENSGSVYRINQDWNVSTVTWNNQPSYAASTVVNIPATTTQTQNSIVDVTPLILDIIANPTTSFGLLLKINNETPYRTQLYASSNHPNNNLHPRLEICYQYPLSVNNVNENKNLSVSLLANALKITNQPNKQIDKIELYNLTGQCIYSTLVNENSSTIDLDIPLELSKGIYFAKVYTEGQSSTIKLGN